MNGSSQERVEPTNQICTLLLSSISYTVTLSYTSPDLLPILTELVLELQGVATTLHQCNREFLFSLLQTGLFVSILKLHISCRSPTNFL